MRGILGFIAAILVALAACLPQVIETRAAEPALYGGSWYASTDGSKRLYIVDERGENGHAVFDGEGDLVGYVQNLYVSYAQIAGNVAPAEVFDVPQTGGNDDAWLYIVGAIVTATTALALAFTAFSGGKGA